MSYKETIEAKNVFYFPYINSIGGVETFFYNLARKYKNNDILILYNHGDIEQIKRLRKYVRTLEYKGQDVICEKAFFNYSTTIIDNVKANEYLQIIHADYEANNMTLPNNDKITRYLCVSQHAKEKFEKLTGKKAEVVYNPLAFIKPKRVLKLISATRLTKEKGKERMIRLIKILNAKHIPFEWTIFTNDKKVINEPNVFYREPNLDIYTHIQDSDYLVQLSDTEAYCYSVVEALTLGVPVLVTPCPVFEEIGIKNGENGFYIPFDMTDIPLKEIYESHLDFSYKPIKDNWKDILAPGQSVYQEELKTQISVVATKNYYDTDLNRSISKDEVLLVNKIRAEQLVKANVAEIIEVDDDGQTD